MVLVTGTHTEERAPAAGVLVLHEVMVEKEVVRQMRGASEVVLGGGVVIGLEGAEGVEAGGVEGVEGVEGEGVVATAAVVGTGAVVGAELVVCWLAGVVGCSVVCWAADVFGAAAEVLGAAADDGVFACRFFNSSPSCTDLHIFAIVSMLLTASDRLQPPSKRNSIMECGRLCWTAAAKYPKMVYLSPHER